MLGVFYGFLFLNDQHLLSRNVLALQNEVTIAS